jgi:hypothetical protein
MAKDGINFDLFSSTLFEWMKSEFSVPRMPFFYSTECLTEMRIPLDSEIGTNKFAFILNLNEREETGLSLECEKESIWSEVKHFRELLELSGGSPLEFNFMIWNLESDGSFEIDSSVVIIKSHEFSGWRSLTAVIFSSDSHLREIHCFYECTSLCRIEIPSSVEVIGPFGFGLCTSLREVIFSRDSHLREINGFVACTALCRIEIPSLVEKIEGLGFCQCTSLHSVMIHAGCRMRGSKGLQNVRAFVAYEDDLRERKKNEAWSIWVFERDKEELWSQLFELFISVIQSQLQLPNLPENARDSNTCQDRQDIKESSNQ